MKKISAGMIVSLIGLIGVAVMVLIAKFWGRTVNGVLCGLLLFGFLIVFIVGLIFFIVTAVKKKKIMKE